ncbi:MAG: hypothetical protein CMJ29_01415 [Phycisphaerae bacterium]|nr:hypothetical protein [Phycisphaerae bacterium]
MNNFLLCACYRHGPIPCSTHVMRKSNGFDGIIRFAHCSLDPSCFTVLPLGRHPGKACNQSSRDSS